MQCFERPASPGRGQSAFTERRLHAGPGFVGTAARGWPSTGRGRRLYPAGLKPCHRPLIAALAESKLIANYWLRRGDSPCANGAAEFLRQTVTGMPAHIRIKLLRGDAGFGEASVQNMAQALGLKFIFVAR